MKLFFLVVFLISFSVAQGKPIKKKTLTKKRSPTLTQLLDPSYSIRLGYFENSQSFNVDRNYLYGSAWVTLRPIRVWDTKSYLELNVQSSDLTRSSNAISDIREGYLEKSFGSFDFKIGRQVIIWGRADKLNPTDSLSTRDYTRLTADDEEQRLGALSSQLSLNFSKFRLSLVWQPEWRDPNFSKPPPPSGVTVVQNRPDKPTEQFGIKLDRYGESVDFSVSYFSGYDRTPDYTLTTVSAQSMILALDFNKIEVLGADMAFNQGLYGFRTEWAYTKTKNADSFTPGCKASQIYGVVGFDRSFFETANLNAQLLYRRVDSWTDPDSLTSPIASTLTTTSQLSSNQQVKDQAGISFRVSNRILNDALEVDLSLLHWLYRSNSFIKPKIVYSFNDHWKGVLGAVVYLGPENSFLGQYKNLTSVFSELRLTF